MAACVRDFLLANDIEILKCINGDKEALSFHSFLSIFCMSLRLPFQTLCSLLARELHSRYNPPLPPPSSDLSPPALDSFVHSHREGAAAAAVAHKISDRGQTNEIAPAKGTTSRRQPERRPREGQRTAMKPRRATLGLTNSPCLASSPYLVHAALPGGDRPSVRGAGGHISRPVSLTCYNGIRLLPRPSPPSLLGARSLEFRERVAAAPTCQAASPLPVSLLAFPIPTHFLPILSRRAKQTWAFGVIPMLIVDAPAASRESREIKLLLQLV